VFPAGAALIQCSSMALSILLAALLHACMDGCESLGAARSLAVLGMLGALCWEVFRYAGGCEYIAALVSNAWNA
jgi:hypothetical protein